MFAKRLMGNGCLYISEWDIGKLWISRTLSVENRWKAQLLNAHLPIWIFQMWTNVSSLIIIPLHIQRVNGIIFLSPIPRVHVYFEMAWLLHATQDQKPYRHFPWLRNIDINSLIIFEKRKHARLNCILMLSNDLRHVEYFVALWKYMRFSIILWKIKNLRSEQMNVYLCEGYKRKKFALHRNRKGKRTNE